MDERETSRERGPWTVTVGLWLLALIPTVGGAHRVMLLLSGQTPTAHDARIASHPTPMLLHVLGATLFTVVGALQFWPKLQGSRVAAAPYSVGDARRAEPSPESRTRVHRALGWVLALFGLLGALSGVWMALFLARPADSTALTSAIRVIVGSAMAVLIVDAARAAKRGSIRQHRASIIRAYAIASAAGTQAFVVGALTLITGNDSPSLHTLALALGWAINVAIGEWIVRRPRRPAVTSATTRSSPR